jgi:hypothetical protein
VQDSASRLGGGGFRVNGRAQRDFSAAPAYGI